MSKPRHYLNFGNMDTFYPPETKEHRNFKFYLIQKYMCLMNQIEYSMVVNNKQIRSCAYSSFRGSDYKPREKYDKIDPIDQHVRKLQQYFRTIFRNKLMNKKKKLEQELEDYNY